MGKEHTVRKNWWFSYTGKQNLSLFVWLVGFNNVTQVYVIISVYLTRVERETGVVADISSWPYSKQFKGSALVHDGCYLSVVIAGDDKS